tara:strand:- start:4126 stop:4704 length:579 start_codon:yes stop_codon:yes gene_type:complete
MAVSRKLGKNIKDWQILTFLGLLVLGYILYNYSSKKNVLITNYQGQMGQKINPSPLPNNENQIKQPAPGGLPSPSDALQDQLNVGSVLTNGPPSVSTVPTVNNQQNIMNPSELLPNDSNSQWASSLPNNELKNINFLSAGQHVGVNTVGTSLRNANLQIRAEPVIQKNVNLCPWNMSTIEPSNENNYGIKTC